MLVSAVVGLNHPGRAELAARAWPCASLCATLSVRTERTLCACTPMLPCAQPRSEPRVPAYTHETRRGGVRHVFWFVCSWFGGGVWCMYYGLVSVLDMGTA